MRDAVSCDEPANDGHCVRACLRWHRSVGTDFSEARNVSLLGMLLPDEAVRQFFAA